MITINSFLIHKFSIPLAPPLTVNTAGIRREFQQRRGLYLTLTGSSSFLNGRKTVKGIGEMVEPVFTRDEISPLEVFSQACRGLETYIIGFEEGLNVPLGRDAWPQWVRCFIDNIRDQDTHVLALIKYTLEQALLVLISEALGLALHLVIRAYIFGHGEAQILEEIHVIRVNSLWNSKTGPETLDRKFSCVKIKVGSNDTERDAALIRQVAHSLPRTYKWIRLDANKMWEMHEYLRFLSALDTSTINAIEYIEEPLKSHSLCDIVSGLRKLPNNCTVALDESLLYENIASVLEIETDLRIIHKTSLHSLRMGNLLSAYSDRITITCTFETGVGLAFLCSIAAAVNPLAFHGIHPLHEMVHADAATEFFFNLMTEVDGEISIKVSDLPSVRELAIRRI